MPTATSVKSRPTTLKSPQVNPLAELKAAVESETQKRAIVAEFITSQLKEGVDYGLIPFNGRTSKPTLFKPGMEKIFALFGIVSHLEKDEETLSMIRAQDIIAYKCKLYKNGQFLSEGRGASSVAERGRVNDTIKIAEKRARMDACLNLGFSEYFTQDLEDLGPDKSTGEPASNKPEKKALPTFQTIEFTVDEKQELQSQSGNPYARLKTDQGTVIAFKNTMDKFEEGSTYLAGGLWEDKNGSTAFVITCPASDVQLKTVSAEKTEEKSGVTLF